MLVLSNVKTQPVMERIFLLICLVGCMMSCDSNETPGTDTFTVDLTREGLTLHNGFERAVYIFAVGRNTDTLIDWGPSFSAENEIAGHSSRTYPFEALPLTEGEKEILVYWWHADIRDGERVPTAIQHALVVRN